MNREDAIATIYGAYLTLARETTTPDHHRHHARMQPRAHRARRHPRRTPQSQLKGTPMDQTQVTELATALRAALTQWTMEPPTAPRDKAGLTHWAAETMNLAGDLCTELGVPSPFFAQ